MEQHMSFYPAQYQPSFDTDQSKIDEFSLDSLNTPDINPDFFTDSPNLFPKVGNSLMGSSGVSAGKMAIKSDEDYMVFSDLGLNSSMAPATTSAFDRTTYSPYCEDTKHQLDSAAININSPEMMMPVSPNKVCPQLDSGYDLLEQQQSNFSQMNEYETMANFDYHHSSPSTNSRSSSISAGSDTYLSEYILSDPAAHLMTGSVDPSLCRVPHSPAGSISSYSSDVSANKKYIQLETVQHQPQQQIVIKQEPADSLYPTVVEEYEYQMVQPVQQQQAPVSSYSTINTNDLSNYYYTNALPSTVTSAIMQQQQQQTVVPITPTTPSASSGASRKRNAGAAFASTSATTSHQSTSASSGSGSKKPRMTKREKQKLMEGDISKYETENRELHTSIDLLERQIMFCKRFLSENVAPVIQRQQMSHNAHHFGPSQSQLVALALESQ